MGILSTNKKIINLGQGYSAGSGISIDDYVISVTGEFGKTYSAGQNIDIYDDQGQLYISGKDWSEDISNASANAYNTTTAWVVENYDNSSAVDYISGVVDNISSNVNNINSAVDYYSGSIDYISSTVDNKLDTTAWSTISGDYATTSYVDMNDDLTYERTTAWVDQNYVADSEISDVSGVWNDTTNCVQTNSGAWSNGGGTYDVITANSANWNNVSSKLDISSFESYTASVASGDYELSAGVGISLYDDALNEITRIDVTGSFDNEEVNQVVETNSAAWSNNPGDVNVNNYVYNNSAINDAVNGLVSSNSASWNGKLNKSDFDTYSGNVNGYISRLYDNDTYFSGAIDYLSGNAGKTYTGISPIVVNNTTNEISADSQDITFGEGLDFTNGVLTVTGAGTTYTGDAQGALDEVYANSGVWLTSHQDISNKLDTTAFSTVSGTFLTAHQPISANEWNSVYETVETNSGSWAGGGTSLTGDAQGAVDEVYTNSANWNDNYSTVTTNSASWGGTPLPMSAGDGIDIQIENDTLVISATGGAGNPEVESYVQTNSASIDDVVSTYETNSGTYLTAHQDISNKLDTTAFSDVSGSFLTAVNIPESASWNDATTAYQTNSASYLTSHQPISAEEWNSNYETVTTNSGVWGGSSLPISAGPGVKLQLVNDTLVVSNNETVLYSSTGVILSAETTLSEPGYNFEKIEFWWGGTPTGTQTQYLVNEIVRPCDFLTFMHAAGGNNVWQQWGRISANSDFSKIIMDRGKSFNFGAATSTAWFNPTCSTGVPDSFYCHKIVGINRINNI